MRIIFTQVFNSHILSMNSRTTRVTIVVLNYHHEEVEKRGEHDMKTKAIRIILLTVLISNMLSMMTYTHDAIVSAASPITNTGECKSSLFFFI